MKEAKIVVAFGTLDHEAFLKSYQLLFEEVKENGYLPALLNQKASIHSGYPLLADVLKHIPKDTKLRIYPLMLNEGRETSEILSLTNEYQTEIHPVLLLSLKKEILSYVKRVTVDPNVTYVLLGHGSLYSNNEEYASLLKELPSNVQMLLHHSDTKILEKEITTIPLMMTCGKHIQVMNEELKENHLVNPYLHGLLEDKQFRYDVLCSMKEFFR